MDNVEHIRIHVPRSALWDQLGEELAELIQALYKLRRAEGNGNPTPVTVEEARAAVQEEVTDVVNIVHVMEFDVDESVWVNEKNEKIFVELIARSAGEVFVVLREPDKDWKRHTNAAAFYCSKIIKTCEMMGYNIDFDPENPKLRRWRKRLEEKR